MDEFSRYFCVLCPLLLRIEPSCDHQETSETSGSFSPPKTWIKMEGRPTMFTLCFHTWLWLKELYIIIWQHLLIRRKRHAESQRAQKGSLCLTGSKADDENFQLHSSVEGVCCSHWTFSPSWGSGFCQDEPVNLLLSYLKWYLSFTQKTPASLTAELRASPLISLHLLCFWKSNSPTIHIQERTITAGWSFCLLEIKVGKDLQNPQSQWPTQHHVLP